jgi:hypothetical protein
MYEVSQMCHSTANFPRFAFARTTPNTLSNLELPLEHSLVEDIASAKFQPGQLRCG